MKIVVKQFWIFLAVMLVVVAAIACGKDSDGQGAGWDEVGTVGASDHEQVVDQSLLTPEADGTFSMANTPTPVPSATPIPEATPTPAPTSTPEPTFKDIYWDDVVAALHGYYVAHHSRSQAALDRVRTAATNASEYTTVEWMQEAAAATRSWPDYPDIEITEITHMKCDEILCKVWFDGVSHPPVLNPVQGQDFPFDVELQLYFRRVNGVFLEDHTHDTWTDEWESTHRE